MLRDIASQCPFVTDHVIVAAVELSTQQVTGARTALVGELPERLRDSDVAREVAAELVPGRWADGPEGHGMTHVLVTVVCRSGRPVFTAREDSWFRAWRYANHFRGAFDGDIYVATPHGWAGCMDHRAGYEPRLAAESLAG